MLVEAGLHRPDRMIRDFVLSGEAFSDQMYFIDRRLDIRNEDVDGDGQDIGGHMPDNTSNEKRFVSNREYSGFGLTGWLKLDWSGNLRSTHRAQWWQSAGDGGGEFASDNQRYGTEEILEKSEASYAHDGTVEALFLDSSVGGGTMIVDDVLVAVAVYGVYSRRQFEEDGVGEGSFSSGGRDSPADTTFTSPYTQRHDNVVENYGVWIPVGVEWQFHRYAKLRIGLTFSATHSDSDHLLRRDVSALQPELPLPNTDGQSDTREVSITSATGAAYNNGLEININDRFILDLLYTATYTSGVSFASYGYVSARYKF
jgi:hypothetical protein